MNRITFGEAARRFGYKSAKTFEKNHIKNNECFPYHKIILGNGRIRKVIDEELIEKAMQSNLYQYQLPNQWKK